MFSLSYERTGVLFYVEFLIIDECALSLHNNEHHQMTIERTTTTTKNRLSRIHG